MQRLVWKSKFYLLNIFDYLDNEKIADTHFARYLREVLYYEALI